MGYVDMKVCGRCSYFKKGEATSTSSTEHGKSFSKETYSLSRCGLSGQTVKFGDPACTSYK